MAIQTASLTAGIVACQNIVISQVRYTAESAAPCRQLIEHFTLGQGEKSITVPKVAQATAQQLTDGVDMVDEEDLGISTVDLTTAEVGLKFVLTDKLIRQFNEDVFKVTGRQMGEAMARKVDRDIIALFSSLNGGVTLGVDNALLNLFAIMGCVGFSESKLYPKPIHIVHHPNAMVELNRNITGAHKKFASAQMGMQTAAEKYMERFYTATINGVDVYWDANIDKASNDSGYGAIFSKNAMCIIESKAAGVERERDASLRGWEIVMVADYGVFELDDAYGAPMLYEIGTMNTTST
ncbi:hypothetical protein LCGC14_0560830 [marine sediment metagenome]|uniref:Capsid protein n=1 Tax=marine sediment metagenome TaxID=412755 RepID=A0A0F9S5L7_9ZZZZ